MSVRILIRDAVKKYGNNTVIQDLTLSIKGGEFFTLLGPSGCGKTTLLRMIAGFNSIEGGDFYFNDTRINDLDPAKRNIGMVFQNYAIFPHMTVRRNVEFGLKNRAFDRSKIHEQADQFLKLMQIDQLADRMPDKLSGGQQQRVALARALCIEPDVLLMDEPLSNLDAKLRESMRFEIKEIQREYGITVMYVTHDQTEAMAMSDRIVVINRGIIQQVGTPRDIYNHPANPFVADFVGKIEFVEGMAKDGAIVLDGCGQKLPYDGPETGAVIVGIRPENITYAEDGQGQLEGVVKTHFYLGDVDDCRVDLGGGQEVRVIADPYESKGVKAGKPVSLSVRNFLVYPKDGSDFRKILT